MVSDNPDAGRATIGTLLAIDEPTDIPFPSCRLVLSVLAFFSFFVMYSARVNLSVALVGMVNTTYIKEIESSANALGVVSPTDDFLCPRESDNVTQKEPLSGDYNWNSQQQGIILGAFFYGYIITQIPGSILTQKFGGKIILLCGVFWTSLLTILTPICTHYGQFGAIVGMRIMEGFGEGGNVPAMHFMISKWSPPLERSKMVTFVYAGAQLGTVIGMPISGLLCEYSSWEVAFYLFGSIGIGWSVLWFFLIYNSPATHPRISPQERNYIEMSQGLQYQGTASVEVPWAKILKSPPVYGVAVAHFTNHWGYYTLLTCLPQYLKYILKFDIKDSGVLSGLPYLILWMMMILGGYCADGIRERRLLSTTTVRKVFNAVGFIGPGACLVATGYVKCNTPLAVALIVIGIGLTGLSWAGWSVNHLDLAPPYAGILMGITNAIATIPGFVGPAIVGVLTYKNQTRKAWRGVFYISAGIYLFGTIFFFIFGSGRRQPWAREPVRTSKVEPVTEEPVTEEPVTEEPVTEEPVTEEPLKDESAMETPGEQEPVKDEGVTDTLVPAVAAETRPSRAAETRPSREAETRPSREAETRPSGAAETRLSVAVQARMSRAEMDEVVITGPFHNVAHALNISAFGNEDVKFGIGF